MKHNNILTGFLTLAFTSAVMLSAQGQAFHKGSFQINLSEGSTSSEYSTSNLNSHNEISGKHIDGCRDPLSLEYGLSSHWGIGLTSGSDIFQINPASFYSFTTPNNQVKVTTSEFTIDCSYHFFITSRTDVSLVGSLGGSSVSFKGNVSDYHYQYNAGGGMVRLGIHGRFFVLKHLGLLAMVSTYSANDSPKDVKGNTVGNTYSTKISGFATEFGLCWRFKK